MNRHPDVLRRTAVLESQHNLLDEIAGIGSDNVAAEELIGRGVSDELHEPRSLGHRAGASVRRERELARSILATGCLDLMFGESDGSDLRPRINDGRHRLVIHVCLVPGDHLSRDDTLFLGLVGEQLPAYGVPDRIHVWKIRAHLGVDGDVAALSEIQPKSFCVYAGKRWLTSDRNEHIVSV